jgi:hypothetical protein
MNVGIPNNTYADFLIDGVQVIQFANGPTDGNSSYSAVIPMRKGQKLTMTYGGSYVPTIQWIKPILVISL